MANITIITSLCIIHFSLLMIKCTDNVCVPITKKQEISLEVKSAQLLCNINLPI